MKAILLLSGGFDSPVAGKRMIEYGWIVDALHFSGRPITDSTPEKKAKKLAKIIGCNKFHLITLGPALAEIASKCNRRFYYIIQRRLMLRLAEFLAFDTGAKKLITGDNLGQVGSQTLENMQVINSAIKMDVARPIICNDKTETIAEARKIGIYEICAGPEMCSALGPRHPATKSTIEKIIKQEKNLDMLKLCKDALATLKTAQL